MSHKKKLRKITVFQKSTSFTCIHNVTSTELFPTSPGIAEIVTITWHTTYSMTISQFLCEHIYLKTKSASCTWNLARAPLSGGVARKNTCGHML